MRLRSIASLVLCLCFASVLVAQDEHSDPISGTWFGYYGTTPRDQIQVRVALSWDGKVLIGNVTTGDDPIEIENAKFDLKTAMVHFEITVPGRGNSDYHYVVDGKVEKDVINGTWHNEAAKGDFQIKRIS